MQGFYKNDDGLLLWSADKVIGDNFELLIDQKDTYSYPIEGWIWADSELIARQSLECYKEQSFPSWTLNLETASYEAPTPYPLGDKVYIWSEEDLSWQELVTD